MTTHSSNSKVPPVATTYRELQSLSHVDALFSSISPDSTPWARAASIGGLGIALLLENLTILHRSCLVAIDSLEDTPSLSFIAKRSIWCRDLLYLANRLASHTLYCNSFAPVLSLRPSPADSLFSLPQVTFLIDTKKQVDLCLHRKFTRQYHGQGATRSLVYAYDQFEPSLNIIQNWKTSNQLLSTLLAQLSSLPLPPDLKPSIASRSIEKCFDSLTIEGDTSLFQQFRLLHQVPELFASELIHDSQHMTTRVARGAAIDVVDAIERYARFLHVMVASTVPIANEMTPSDYHAIRSRLGKTSGSQSDSLAKHVFSLPFRQMLSEAKEFVLGKTFVNALQPFTHKAKNNAKDEQSPTDTPLRRRTNKTVLATNELLPNWLRSRFLSSLNEIGELICLWRDYHINFPRNVLGGSRVRSLIGTDDAIDHVSNLSGAAADNLRRDVCDVRPSSAQLSKIPFTFPPAIMDFDTLLLTIVGDCTKERFPDVQNRNGYFE